MSDRPIPELRSIIKDPHATITQNGYRGISIQRSRLPDGSTGWAVIEWRYDRVDAPKEWSRLETIFLSNDEMDQIAERLIASRKKIKKL